MPGNSPKVNGGMPSAYPSRRLTRGNTTVTLIYNTLSMKPPPSLALILLAGMTGCAALNKVSATLDMASTHADASVPAAYEGRLVTSKRIGSMTALQFSDGQIFNVSSAPDGLAPGDTLRLYKSDDGLVAHIWKLAPENAAAQNALAPLISSR